VNCRRRKAASVLAMLTFVCSNRVVAQTTIKSPEVQWLDYRSDRPFSLTLPTMMERYASMRVAAMGEGLTGVVEDALTDRYRNPAFVSQVERLQLFMDFGREAGKTPVLFSVGRTIVLGRPRPQLNSLRLGLFAPTGIGRFGLSLHGDYGEAERSDQSFVRIVRSADTSSLEQLIQQRTVEKSADLHVWWAGSISEEFKGGADYTIGRVENTSEISSTRISETEYITSVYRQLYRLSNSLRQERTEKLDVHVGRLAFLWTPSPEWSLDVVGKLELLDVEVEFPKLSKDEYLQSYEPLDPLYSFWRYERLNSDSTEFSASVGGTNYSLVANLKRRISSVRSVSYIVDVAYQTFEVEEAGTRDMLSRTVNESQSDTSVFESQSGSEFSASRPDGGTMSARIGWGNELRRERVLIGFALLASGYRGDSRNALNQSASWSSFSRYETASRQFRSDARSPKARRSARNRSECT